MPNAVSVRKSVLQKFCAFQSRLCPFFSWHHDQILHCAALLLDLHKAHTVGSQLLLKQQVIICNLLLTQVLLNWEIW